MNYQYVELSIICDLKRMNVIEGESSIHSLLSLGVQNHNKGKEIDMNEVTHINQIAERSNLRCLRLTLYHIAMNVETVSLPS